jgi:uncharacterized protein (DUF1015 family)
VFARVWLEPFGPGSGIRPHERTLSEPKEDRYRLLRATGVNTSPVVGLYEDSSGVIPSWLDGLAGPPVAEVTDDDQVRHRLWRVPAEGDDHADVIAALGGAPITIADGHHRYETALRYRDERAAGTPAADDEPAWGFILMLLLEPRAGPLTVLATHRVLTGIAGNDHAGMDALPELFEIGPASRAELAATFAPGVDGAGGRGRFGLWTRDAGYLLTARRPAFQQLIREGGPALRQLDVSLAGAAIERLTGIDASATEGGRIHYTKDAAEAMRWVDERTDGADAALLLEPTPQSDVVAVAAEGDVMPQKSTYIYPKALTGLVINPLE